MKALLAACLLAAAAGAAEREVRLFHPEERWLHSYGLPGASREPSGPGAGGAGCSGASDGEAAG